MSRATSATDEQLFEHSEQRQAEAQALLVQGNLLATIQQAGPAFISGSYAFHLMTRRDLDVYVRLADDPDVPAFFELGGTIVRHYPVLKASFSNHFICKFPGFDHGLYWGIQLKYQGYTWKLDLWGYGPAHFAQHCAEVSELQKRLAPADRAVILRIKEALRSGDGYGNGVTSMDIYSAVLTGKVTTMEQFESWIAAGQGSKREA